MEDGAQKRIVMAGGIAVRGVSMGVSRLLPMTRIRMNSDDGRQDVVL